MATKTILVMSMLATAGLGLVGVASATDDCLSGALVPPGFYRVCLLDEHATSTGSRNDVVNWQALPYFSPAWVYAFGAVGQRATTTTTATNQATVVDAGVSTPLGIARVTARQVDATAPVRSETTSATVFVWAFNAPVPAQQWVALSQSDVNNAGCTQSASTYGTLGTQTLLGPEPCTVEVPQLYASGAVLPDYPDGTGLPFL